MITRIRPLVLGYIRRYPSMNADEFGRVQAGLAASARRLGYTLGTVHVEELPTDPNAFEELLASAAELKVPAVIVPSRAHLGRPDHPESKASRLRRETGAEILIAEMRS